MPLAASASISGRQPMHQPPCCDRRSFAAYNRWVDDALRHRADGYRLLDSPLLGLPGVKRPVRRRSRRSAFADMPETQAHLRPATERISAILTTRQVLALQLFCDG